MNKIKIIKSIFFVLFLLLIFYYELHKTNLQKCSLLLLILEITEKSVTNVLETSVFLFQSVILHTAHKIVLWLSRVYAKHEAENETSNTLKERNTPYLSKMFS